MSMLQIAMVILRWTMLVGMFIHDNLFFHTHLSQYSQGCFIMNIKQLCQLKCMSVCNGNSTNHKYANFNLPAWFNHLNAYSQINHMENFPNCITPHSMKCLKFWWMLEGFCNTFHLLPPHGYVGGLGCELNFKVTFYSRLSLASSPAHSVNYPLTITSLC